MPYAIRWRAALSPSAFRPEAPRGLGEEEPDVTPRPDVRGDVVGRLEDERLEPSRNQMSRGGEAERPGADDDDGQFIAQSHRQPHAVRTAGASSSSTAAQQVALSSGAQHSAFSAGVQHDVVSRSVFVSSIVFMPFQTQRVPDGRRKSRIHDDRP